MQLLLDSGVCDSTIQHIRMTNGVEVSREIPWLELEGSPGVLLAHSSAQVDSFGSGSSSCPVR